MGLVIKNHLSLQETKQTWVQSLSWEDPLEGGKAAHSSILAWRIPRTEEPGRLQSMGLQRDSYPSIKKIKKQKRQTGLSE